MLDPRGGPDSGDAAAKRARVMNAPKELSFTRTAFHSNKLFSNTFGEQVREVESRVRFFCENRAWYTERGIPYQLGFLLSGLPGSGKTSAIRAIANHTKRHIINVNFASITTATQLKNLLFSERLSTFVDSHASETQTLSIPIDQRLYVLEEIDAIGDIVQQRYEGMKPRNTVPDELTLAEILTALDGTIESPGRMLVMTSNHPEYLDEALIRPGRIDVCVSFTRAPRALIVEMYESFFQTTFPAELVPELPDMRMTPAEVGQCLFKHFGSPDPSAMCRCLCAAADSAHTESDRRRRLSARRREQVVIEAARSSSDMLLNPSMPTRDSQEPMSQSSEVHDADSVCGKAGVVKGALAPGVVAAAEKELEVERGMPLDHIRLCSHNLSEGCGKPICVCRVQGTRGSLSLSIPAARDQEQRNQFLDDVRNNLPDRFVECDNTSNFATIADADVPLLSQTCQN